MSSFPVPVFRTQTVWVCVSPGIRSLRVMSWPLVAIATVPRLPVMAPGALAVKYAPLLATTVLMRATVATSVVMTAARRANLRLDMIKVRLRALWVMTTPLRHGERLPASLHH